MISRRTLMAVAVVLCVALGARVGYSFFKETTTADGMTKAAAGFAASLSDEQRAKMQFKFDAPERFGWHFIPKPSRKGLQLKDMNEAQRKAAHDLLRVSLSELGYEKSVQIMELETLLHHLEKGKGANIRDAERYYFSLFGTPDGKSRWGLSVEGHHLSLNYVVEGTAVVSSSPQFMATNPAIVQDNYLPEFPKGKRILAAEDMLAFELLAALSDEQRAKAIIAEKAPADIRGPADAQPPQEKPAGIAASELSDEQKEILEKLIYEYIAAMPSDVAAQRRKELAAAGTDNVHFAWAGATKPGVGHYYRVQGPTLLIEFVNVQPDAAGNPANHIHCVWRDPRGDFGMPAK